MGHGHLRDKNKLKKQYLSSAVKYIEQLENENRALKSDPDSIVGRFIGQYNEMYSQNSRLSVLCATLLKRLGEKAVLTKAEMAAFDNQRINIKWDLPEGVEKHEDATSYTFSYELQPNDAPQQQQPIVLPTELPGPTGSQG